MVASKTTEKLCDFKIESKELEVSLGGEGNTITDYVPVSSFKESTVNRAIGIRLTNDPLDVIRNLNQLFAQVATRWQSGKSLPSNSAVPPVYLSQSVASDTDRWRCEIKRADIKLKQQNVVNFEAIRAKLSLETTPSWEKETPLSIGQKEFDLYGSEHDRSNWFLTEELITNGDLPSPLVINISGANSDVWIGCNKNTNPSQSETVIDISLPQIPTPVGEEATLLFSASFNINWLAGATWLAMLNTADVPPNTLVKLVLDLNGIIIWESAWKKFNTGLFPLDSFLIPKSTIGSITAKIFGITNEPGTVIAHYFYAIPMTDGWIKYSSVTGSIYDDSSLLSSLRGANKEGDIMLTPKSNCRLHFLCNDPITVKLAYYPRRGLW